VIDDDRGREHLVYASYHQLFLAPVGVSPIFDSRDSGPLVSVTDNAAALIIVTGCADGPVLVTTRVTPGPPSQVDAGWEAQESVSIVIGEPLRLSSPTWTALHEPVITPSVPGPHRVRVSARGRTGHAMRASRPPLSTTWSRPGPSPGCAPAKPCGTTALACETCTTGP
jgi:hypothetical protein